MKDLILNPTDPSLLASIFLKLDQSTAQTITASPILNWLTASQALMTDSNKKLISVDYLDQAVKTTSSPTFAQITDSALTSGRIIIAGTNGILTDDADLQWVSGTTLQLGLKDVGGLGKFTSLTNGQTALTDGAIRCYALNQTQSLAMSWSSIVGSSNIGLVPGSTSNIYLGVTNNSQGGVNIGNGTSYGTVNGRFTVIGNPANTTGGTGTVSCTINGTTITGISTNFNIVIGAGYSITIGANTYAIREVTSATSVKIYGTIIATATNSAWSYTKPTFAARNYAQTNDYSTNSLGQVNTENTLIPSYILHLGNISASTQAWIMRTVTSNNNRYEVRNDTDNTTPFWIDGNAPDNLLQLGLNGIGIKGTTATAQIHLAPGTATASTAPLKFSSGTLLTTAEVGSVEFLTDAYYGTITTGAARKTFAFLESPTFTGVVTSPSIVSTGTITLKGYTVATLPAGTVGMTAYVTDALAPTFLATVVGGGAVVTPVFYNGTNWVTY